MAEEKDKVSKSPAPEGEKKAEAAPAAPAPAEKKAEAPAAGRPAGGAPHAAGGPARKKSWRSVSFGRVYIQCSFNNTIISLTDERGDVLAWSTAGGNGFRGTKKGTPFAAGVTATRVARRAVELGVKQVAVYIKGPGPGRETAVRSLGSAGLVVVSLKDVSPLPHNGCRPPKARRV
ncbi:MAG: 30S ribosomal protein S11 [Elusimicrobia bacterium]|nr:30S ribosomal protein S11 [Elusimicrobiota bacterium]